MNKKVYIKTFGCQMNEHDSERLLAILQENGFAQTEEMQNADFIIFNTCSVRENPENKAASFLGLARRIKEKNNAVVLAIAGCVANQWGARLQERFPYVDLVLGTDLNAIDSVYKLYEKVSTNKVKIASCDFSDTKDFTINTKISKNAPYRAHVTAMVGCDNFCSYCIVPYVRGREKSRSIKNIVDDVNKLIDKGVIEITLLGQNIANFGRQNNEGLVELLYKLADVQGLRRLRFLTSHPRDVTTELLDAFDNIPVLCESLHLPAQHGSNKVLKLMNRGYTKQEYLALVERVHGLKKDVALYTDLIVGFPGEDEDDFAELMDLMEKAGFDNSFSFVYSPRPGTAAAKLGFNKALLPVYKERLNLLKARQNEISLEKNKKMHGKIFEILVERKDNTSGLYAGRTRSNKLVNFFASKSIDPGQFVNVKVTQAYSTHLRGEVYGTQLQ